MHITIYLLFSSLCLMCFCGLLFSSHSASCVYVNPSKCFIWFCFFYLVYSASMEHDKYLSIYYDFSGKFNVGCFNRDNLFSVFFSNSMRWKEVCLQNGTATNIHMRNVYMCSICSCNLVNPIYKSTEPLKNSVYAIRMAQYITYSNHNHTGIKSAWACTTMNRDEYICIFDHIEDIQ